MKISKKYFGWLAASLIMLGLAVTMQQQTVQAEKVTYSVAPIYPENQTNSDLGYYDLKVTPGLKQEVGLAIQNDGAEPITVDVTPNTAITNDNGLIDYSQNKVDYDNTLKYPFDELMSGVQRVTVPAKGSQNVMFTLTSPTEKFTGEILGGFYITQVNKSKVDQSLQHSKGASLTNQYSYVLGVKLHQTDETVKPRLRLNDVKAGLHNDHTAILANLQNIRANSVGEMSVKSEIRKVGQKKILYHNSRKDLQMAPNSNFDYAIDLNNTPIKAGRYNIKLKVKSNKGSWILTKDFTITAKEANKYNPKAVELPQTNWWLYGLIGFLILLILILIWLLLRRKRQAEDE